MFLYHDEREPPREDIVQSLRQLYHKRNWDQFNMFEMRLQDSPKTAQRFGIYEAPKLLLFHWGQLLTSLPIESGNVTYSELVRQLNELVGFTERPLVRQKLSFEEVIGGSKGREDMPQRVKALVRPTNMLGLLGSDQ